MEDERGTVMVHAEVPSDDVVRSFYEVPDMLAMMLWRDKRTTFAEALTDLDGAFATPDLADAA